MTLLPLVLSLTPAIVLAPTGTGPCRFCGLQAASWMRMTAYADEPVSACLLCSLCHGLDRPRIADEAALIWAPEMTQRALVAVVRRFHIICHQNGVPPTMDRVPRAGSAILSQAWGVHLALLRRAATAELRLGSRLVSDLADALAGLPNAGAERAPLLGGLRLLPLGRFFDDEGVDVYPQALSDLMSQTGAAA